VTSEWPLAPLGDVTTVLTDGDWIESKDQSPSGIRLLQTGNVGLGQYRSNDNRARYISAETFERLSCTEVVAGDVLVSRLPDPIGRACVIPELNERTITAVDCAVLRFTEVIIPEFFVYYSQSSDYLRTVEAKATGTTRQRISRSNLSQILIPLPPLDEQKRIVAKLDEAMELSANMLGMNQQVQSLVSEFKTSHTKVLLSEIAEGEVKTLPQLATNLDSKRVPITKADRHSGNIPYYGASGIVDYVADQIFDERLLLISEDGANLLARSTPIAFSIDGPAWVNNHAHVLRFESPVTQAFVEMYLESISVAPWVSGAAQPKLNQSALNSIPIRIPDSIEEQIGIMDRFATIQEDLSVLNDQLEVKKAKILDLKNRYLTAAFAGEL
jgi:type I restriction enzyme S subunit